MTRRIAPLQATSDNYYAASVQVGSIQKASHGTWKERAAVGLIHALLAIVDAVRETKSVPSPPESNE
jgi:hypothetical protein